MRELAVLGDRDHADRENEKDEDVVDEPPPRTVGIDQCWRDEHDAYQ